MKMRNILLIWIVNLILINGVWAGNNPQDTLKFFYINAGYSVNIPGGDMAERFGWNSNVSWQFGYKTKKNFTFGINTNFFFGNTIKDTSVMMNLYTQHGFIIDKNGSPAEVNLYERGYMLSVYAGKILPLLGPNINSGIVVEGGVGFVQHKIKILDQYKSVPALEGDYLKGYDRLTNGLLLHQFIGYQYIGNSHFVNFKVGFEFFQGFTQNRRDYNYDTRERDTRQRTDLLYGFRLFWTIPLYKRRALEYYVY